MVATTLPTIYHFPCPCAFMWVQKGKWITSDISHNSKTEHTDISTYAIPSSKWYFTQSVLFYKKIETIRKWQNLAVSKMNGNAHGMQCILSPGEFNSKFCRCTCILNIFCILCHKITKWMGSSLSIFCVRSSREVFTVAENIRAFTRRQFLFQIYFTEKGLVQFCVIYTACPHNWLRNILLRSFLMFLGVFHRILLLDISRKENKFLRCDIGTVDIQFTIRKGNVFSRQTKRYENTEYIYVEQICSTTAGAIGWRLTGCYCNICTHTIDTITLHWSVRVYYDHINIQHMTNCFLSASVVVIYNWVNWYTSVGRFPNSNPFMCISLRC